MGQQLLAAAVDLVLPSTCAGCGGAGGPLCPRCRDELIELALPEMGPLAPVPAPAGWPGCTGVLRYEGVAARLATQVKDGGRRDLVPLLGRLLADAAGRAIEQAGPVGSGPVALVPIPSSPAAARSRGDRPMLVLARQAVRDLGARAVLCPALRMARGTRDQARLSRTERADNLRGAMRVDDPAAVRGRVCLLVDDVLTSGATLSEGRRSLLQAGASRVCMAVVMVTARHPPPKPPSPSLPFASFSD